MTAFTLKTIAVTSMFLDHMAVAFPEHIPMEFRIAGRLAYPIFVYLVAEGFRHTKSPEKFLLRLFIFALISQIPYDLALAGANGQIDFFTNTNIFYTLFLGGVAIYGFEHFMQKNKPTLSILCGLLPAAIVAKTLTTDYGGLGVLFIFAMYVIKKRKLKLAAFVVFCLSQFIGIVPMFMAGEYIRREYWFMIPAALVAVPLIAKYNGQRGYNLKWLFYAVYPAHLTLFAVIAHFI